MGELFLSVLGISVSIGLIIIGLILLTPFLNKRYAAKWKYLIWIFLALRKAYTETLLSMLHKQCVRKTVLSTQFYGGTKIMKKRFKNILVKSRKKNGICMLIGAVVLTVSLGMMISCSAANEDAANKASGNISKESETEVVQPEKESETEAFPTEPMSADTSSADNYPLENTITLTFSKEGEQEQKQAVLAVGNGYSFYLPEDEQWHLSAADLWITDINEQVALWVTHFEGESVDSVRQILVNDGYAEEDSYKWWKQEGDLLYHAEEKAFGDKVWGIFYSYPVDFEDGWGREFPVIVNTFALSDGADNPEYVSVSDLYPGERGK